MARKVLDVGQCDFDHSRISSTLKEHFEVEVVRAHSHDEAVEQAQKESFDLILLNRVLDADGTMGLDILQSLKSNTDTAEVPTILVSNFEDAQAAATAAGAVPGFGKAAIDTPETIETLRQYLA